MSRVWRPLFAAAGLVALATVPQWVSLDGAVGFLPPVDVRAAAVFLAAAVFGVAGWVGGSLAFVLTHFHPLAWDAWTFVGLSPIVGAGLLLALPRVVPGFDTTLRAPASLGLAATAATTWALGVGWLQARAVFPSAVGVAMPVWASAHLATLLLGVAPLASLAEVTRELGREGRLGATLRREGWRIVGLVGLGGTLALGLELVGRSFPVSRTWGVLLLLVPVALAARRWQTPGAIAMAAFVGLSHLQVASLVERSLQSHWRVVELAGLALTLWAMGALLGAGEQRRAALLARLREQNDLLARDLQRVVRALSGAVGAKDEYTEGHLQRVTAYALRVGRSFGLTGHQLDMLAVASSLHDVGKIGIPGAVLNKPGPLTFEERAAMAKHPEIGAQLLAGLEGLEDAAPIVLHHQERFDGRTDGAYPGYPAGLAGETIPLGARIIAVVDAFDAMTTNRPYRAALPIETAIAELRREAGAQFDPRVVEAFLDALDSETWDEPLRVSA